jgi:hypothetical protein
VNETTAAIATKRECVRKRTDMDFPGVKLVQMTSSTRDFQEPILVLAVSQFSKCVVAVFVTATCVSAQARAAIPSAENIVALMTQSQAVNRAGLRPYTVTRAYRLFEGTYTDEVTCHRRLS